MFASFFPTTSLIRRPRASRLLSYPNARTDFRDQQHAALELTPRLVLASTATIATNIYLRSYRNGWVPLNSEGRGLLVSRTKTRIYKLVILKHCLRCLSTPHHACSSSPPSCHLCSESSCCHVSRTLPAPSSYLNMCGIYPTTMNNGLRSSGPQTDPLLSPKAHSQLTQQIHFLVNKRK